MTRKSARWITRKLSLILVAEPFPPSGHGMPEEFEDLAAELVEGLVIPVVSDVFVHQAPQAFDGIEMGTVGRKEVQHDFALSRRKPLFETMLAL